MTLSLGDGSVITLQKSSSLTLEGMRQVTGAPEVHDTRVKLQSGRLQTVVQPQGNMGRFEIRTPVAVSAVRGTQFRSTFEPGTERATTETLEGLVAVSAAAADVPLPAGFGTRVERDGPPAPPVPLLPPPDLQAMSGTNNVSRLQLQWAAVAGAAAYRVQLAPDSEFHSFIVDTDSAVPQIDMAAPPDGNYWLRVRSIDNLGPEGPDAVRTIVQRLLPASPALAGRCRMQTSSAKARLSPGRARRLERDTECRLHAMRTSLTCFSNAMPAMHLRSLSSRCRQADTSGESPE